MQNLNVEASGCIKQSLLAALVQIEWKTSSGIFAYFEHCCDSDKKRRRYLVKLSQWWNRSSGLKAFVNCLYAFDQLKQVKFESEKYLEICMPVIR